MRKLGLVALAASAAVVPVSAQTVPDPDGYYGVSDLRLNLPSGAAAAATPVTPTAPRAAPVQISAAPKAAPRAPQAGVTWKPWQPEIAARAPVPPAAARAPAPPAAARAPAPAPQLAARAPAPAPRAPAPAPRIVVAQAAPQVAATRPAAAATAAVSAAARPVGQIVRQHRGRIMGSMPHPGRHMRFTRIGRGGTLPPFWFGPRFHVRNHGLYGFPQPFQGGRWVRYYDDALLIDRQGRVHDSREDYDWDRYGERWSDRDDGIPEYAGDYDSEERDYDYADDYEDDYRDDYEVRADGPPHGYDGPPPPMRPGYGYGAGYGYGCGCGPVVVTETITTTAPVYEEVTTYEYVREPARARVKPRHRGKTIHRAPAAPPHHGEKG